MTHTRRQPSVCVVDDDPSVREAVEALLQTEGLQVETFVSASEFLERPCDQAPACLILDVHLPGFSGLELQEELVRTGRNFPIIFLTGRGTIPMSVLAIKSGALEFLTKPFEPEALLGATRRGLACLNGNPQGGAAVNASGLVGQSAALLEVLAQIELVARTDATVLITGESGSGKELVARAIHERSARSTGPLIKVNCSAIPESLFESELFGHTRGAFTGALRDKPGRIEVAHRGTLILDEIGEVPLAMQPKLLRVIQEREIERVGDTTSRLIDVRIIAVTNRNLRAEVAAGRFREDLFYRLSVFPIENPPLRHRRDDIAALAKHMLRLASTRLNLPVPSLSDSAAQELAAREWPGNVRELQNVIERAAILAQGGPLQFDGAAFSTSPRATQVRATVLTREELRSRERENIAAALARTGGRVFGAQGAAALLGTRPTTLYSRIVALGLRDHRR